jgi:ABC-type sulfate transport system permease subunit
VNRGGKASADYIDERCLPSQRQRPLHVEILYNEYDFVGAFAVASLLALLALVTLVLKSFLEWRHGAELAAARRH